MLARTLALVPVAAAMLSASAHAADDLCKGKKPGTVTFYAAEVARDKPLPEAVTMLAIGKPMFALACLTDSVGPQADGGTKLRAVLYAKATKTEAYSSGSTGKQYGVVRPALSKPRRDIVFSLDEDFGDFKSKLDPGEYEFRLQVASEKGTGKLDVQLDLKNDVAYVQELRTAGYLADGTVKVVFAP